MAQNQKINPDRLKRLLDACKLSQKELADRIGVDVGTLSRWKTGKIVNIRADKLAKLSAALGVEPTDICADGPPPEATPERDDLRRNQITMTIDTACRNALGLVARRYGVTRQQIVEIAPLLFAIMAEQSLTAREKQLQAYYDAAPAHLRRDLLAPHFEHPDDKQLLDEEEQSIEKRDLFAAKVGSWREDHDKENPFARFLRDRLAKTGLKPGGSVRWDGSEAPFYRIGLQELDDLLGEDEKARDLVLDGTVALAEMPGETRRKTSQERAAWVKEKAEQLAREDKAAMNSLERVTAEDLRAGADIKEVLEEFRRMKNPREHEL